MSQEVTLVHTCMLTRFADYRFAAKGFRAVVKTGGIKIACVTTRQNGASFDDAYGAEMLALETRLEGSDSPPPRASSSRVIASLPFAHIGSDAWDLNYFFMWATRSEVRRSESRILTSIVGTSVRNISIAYLAIVFNAITLPLTQLSSFVAARENYIL